MAERPGGKIAARPLQFIWIVDCSLSMAGKKIEALNHAISECIKPMQDVAHENPNAQVLVRVLKFSTGAQWEVSQPTDVHDFVWRELTADGETDMGKALSLVAEALKMENMPQRGLPPVLVLVTDGMPTDDFKTGLRALMDQPWGRKAVRVGIAIGDEHDVDMDVLQRFIGNPELKPLVAHNAADLANKIKWVSTIVTQASSRPSSKLTGSGATGSVLIPAPPKDVQALNNDDVF